MLPVSRGGRKNTMSSYMIRPATPADIDALVRHRISMFEEMQTPIDAAAVDRAFRDWLARAMPAGEYRAWLVETDDPPEKGFETAASRIVAGGGMTLIPWPPGPWYTGGRIAFVYNVYTEPAHRRRGLARMVMAAIHACCGAEGVGMAALNASGQAQSLYASMGYQLAPAPMMMCGTE
jgi:GNAT superfamily N-acetyltransferase